MIESLVTTIDNPWNPFTHYDEWNAFDTEKGYNTNSYLARICVYSNELSDKDKTEAINQAVDEIVKQNVLGIYKKVSREVAEPSDDTQDSSE